MKRSLGALLAAFPDYRARVEQVVTEGDAAVVRWTASGTHRGEFLGLAPTGRGATWTGSAAFRVACGWIAEAWSEEDALALLRQLGAID